MQLLKEIGENAVALFVMDKLNASEMVINPNDSEMVRSIKSGAIWTGVDDIVHFYNTGGLHLMQGDTAFYLDDTVYNTAVIYGINAMNLTQVVGSISDKLPFGTDVNNTLAVAGLRVGAKTVRDMIDMNYPDSSLRYLTHASSWWN